MKTKEKHNLETIECELDGATQTLTELQAEQDGIADRLKTEALNAAEDGVQGTSGLTKTLQRAHALPLLVWAAQLRHAQLSEQRRRIRLTQIEQEQRPLEEATERAEPKRRHALYTSDRDARLEAEAEIEEARRQLLPLVDEKRDLQLAERRSVARIRQLEANGPMHWGRGSR